MKKKASFYKSYIYLQHYSDLPTERQFGYELTIFTYSDISSPACGHDNLEQQVLKMFFLKDFGEGMWLLDIDVKIMSFLEKSGSQYQAISR